MFHYTGFREGEGGGGDDSSGTIILCHPFHNPYLILCLLFSVTIEPSSWLLPGLRLLAGGISLSMVTSQRRCRVEKVKGGKKSTFTQGIQAARSRKKCHTDAETHFSVLHLRETSFFLETLPDHLQNSFALIISRRLTSVPKTATLWYTHKHSNFKLSDLGCFFFSPGLLPTTVEKLQVFTDVFPLFVLVWFTFQLCSPKQQPSANLWLFSEE